MKSSSNVTFSQKPPDIDLRFATSDDVLAWRDRIVGEAAIQLERSQVGEALHTLRKLEFSTIDAKTLETTDQFFPKIAGDRKVVASFNPQRLPRADEVVIIYGNYPHMFERNGPIHQLREPCRTRD